MPNAETIRAQTTPEDGALFAAGLDNSKWRPEAHVAFTEDARQKGILELQNDTPFGKTIIVQFDKMSTFLEDIELEFTPPALTVPVNGTYIRYCDWLAFAIIENIQWNYTANNLQNYSMDMEWSDVQYMTLEKRANEEKLAGGGLSAAARNTYAAAPTTLRVSIPTPWKDRRNAALGISALASRPTLTIKLRESSYLIQTDGTKPTGLSIPSSRLVFQQIHTTGHTRQEYTSVTNQPNGIPYLYDDRASLDFTIPANTLSALANGKFVADITGIDGAVRKLRLIVRTSDQLNSQSASPGRYEIDTTYIEGMTAVIKANGMDLMDEQTQDTDGVRQTQKFHRCRYDTLQVEALWEEFPEAKNVTSGNLSFGNFTAPKLTISNPSLAGNHPELTVTVLYDRHNWLVHQRGNLNKVWR